MSADTERLKLWQSLAFKMIAAVREAYPPGTILDTDGPDAIRRLRERAEKAEACARPEVARSPDPRIEPFVVKHYEGNNYPSIKGNGFDGLQVGDDREEAQNFVDWINARLCTPSPLVQKPYACPDCGHSNTLNGRLVHGSGCPRGFGRL